MAPSKTKSPVAVPTRGKTYPDDYIDFLVKVQARANQLVGLGS